MFSVSSEPVLLSEAGLHGLCVSLNTPVLNIDELPVGPARASIVLFDGGYGSLELAIAIRSIESRQVAVFTFQGRISGKKTPAQAMEAASGFAEGMGFLFDEDVVSSGSDGRARAMGIWLELTEVPDVPEIVELNDERPQLSPAIPLEQPEEELVLEETFDLEKHTPLSDDDLLDEVSDSLSSEIWLEELPPAPLARVAEPETLLDIDEPPLAPSAATPPQPVTPPPAVEQATPVAPPEPVAASRASAPPKRVSLTKFRQPPKPSAPAPGSAASERDAESAKGSSALGRISLVRRSVGGEAAEGRPNLLLRLLASF